MKPQAEQQSPPKMRTGTRHFMGFSFGEFRASLGVCVRSFVRSLPAGINWTEATPKGGVQGMEHGLEHAPPHCVPHQRQKMGGRYPSCSFSGWMRHSQLAGLPAAK